MIDVVRAFSGLVEHGFDAARLLDQGADFVRLRRVVDVDVRHLVIGDRERRAGPGIDHLVAELVADRQQPVLSQDAIEVDRRGDVAQSVLREHDHLRAVRLVVPNQIAADASTCARSAAAAGSPGPTRCRL